MRSPSFLWVIINILLSCLIKFRENGANYNDQINNYLHRLDPSKINVKVVVFDPRVCGVKVTGMERKEES